MMNYSFSPSKVAFYANELKETYYAPARQWPADAYEISDTVTNEFTSQPPEGKRLGEIDGQPVWVDIPAPTVAEMQMAAEAKKNQLRAVADSEIVWRQDAADKGIATEQETAELAEWKEYRVLLMRVDTAKPVWPETP